MDHSNESSPIIKSGFTIFNLTKNDDDILGYFYYLLTLNDNDFLNNINSYIKTLIIKKSDANIPSTFCEISKEEIRSKKNDGCLILLIIEEYKSTTERKFVCRGFINVNDIFDQNINNNDDVISLEKVNFIKWDKVKLILSKKTSVLYPSISFYDKFTLKKISILDKSNYIFSHRINFLSQLNNFFISKKKGLNIKTDCYIEIFYSLSKDEKNELKNLIEDFFFGKILIQHDIYKHREDLEHSTLKHSLVYQVVNSIVNDNYELNWFLEQEEKLFFCRSQFFHTKEEIIDLTINSNININNILKKEHLKSLLNGEKKGVPFSCYPKLLELKKCDLVNGFVKIGINELVDIILPQEYNNRLSKIIKGMKEMFHQISLNNPDFIYSTYDMYLENHNIMVDRFSKKSEPLNKVIDIEDLVNNQDDLPLCMRRNLQILCSNELKKNHFITKRHLNFKQRYEFTSYLLENYTKETVDDFIQLNDEDYKEKYKSITKRRVTNNDGFPHLISSCEKLTEGTPDYGCPYKKLSSEDIQLLLKNSKMANHSYTDNEINNIIYRNEVYGYAEACKTEFEISHKKNIKKVFNNPSNYTKFSLNFKKK
jgi:hypothetical protein